MTHHLSHTNFHTPSFTHHFVTHHLSHTIFDTPSFTPLCHTPSFTHRHRRSFTHHLSRTTLCHTILHHSILHTPLCHTPSFTTPSFTHNFVTHHVSHATLSHTHNFVLLLDPPPPPLSFLLSPSPLQHLVLIIGRNCFVGLSGPLISQMNCIYCIAFSMFPATQGTTVSTCRSSSRILSPVS